MAGFIVNFEHISHLCSSVSIVNFEHVIAGWEEHEQLRGFNFLIKTGAVKINQENGILFRAVYSRLRTENRSVLALALHGCVQNFDKHLRCSVW